MYFLINRGNLAFHARMILFAAQRKKETTKNEKAKEKLSGFFVGRKRGLVSALLVVCVDCLSCCRASFHNSVDIWKFVIGLSVVHLLLHIAISFVRSHWGWSLKGITIIRLRLFPWITWWVTRVEAQLKFYTSDDEILQRLKTLWKLKCQA